MENKNVFIAIALSMTVLLFWQYAFVDTTKDINKKNVIKNEKIKNKKIVDDNSITPNINQTNEIISLSRSDSIKNSQRVQVENKNIIGSILLKGAIIDNHSVGNILNTFCKES